MRTLIIGGAASGKSEFAENLVTKSTLHKIYLASANIYDDEMQRKVEKHKIRRGNNWETISEPLEAKKMITNLELIETEIYAKHSKKHSDDLALICCFLVKK